MFTVGNEHGESKARLVLKQKQRVVPSSQVNMPHFLPLYGLEMACESLHVGFLLVTYK